MGSLSGASGSCPGAVEESDDDQMPGLFRGGAGGIRGAPGDEGPCPVICCRGNI